SKSLGSPVAIRSALVRERDEASLKRAESIFVEALVEQVPPRVSADWNLNEDIADAIEVVAVGIDLRHECAILSLGNLWRIDRDQTGGLLGTEILAIIMSVQRIVHTQEVDSRPRNIAVFVGRYRREMHLIGRHQSSSGDCRSRARRRLCPVFDPSSQVL